MQPHVHITPVHLLANIAAVVAVFGTLHLYLLTTPESKFSKGFIALGF